ncbi:TraR/DksA family transcriptional regulator [Oceanicola sp. D3]|uniref:TraR/DksA family transcriptional regulator n=1 Tax=Oceanicola sp. D3 TaxID=2587163 RepID=UPI00111F21F9|nr:TraR/DksA family transcriptional regulator [Oceanicola sp. D3]QDC11597.1 TraR/DksA family transcriptional regulator [Oceanicola sp. D3]
MDDPRQQAFRRRLQARLQELSDGEVLGQEGRKIVELDQQSVGRLSRMDALQSQAMAQAASRMRSAEKQRINAALARMEEGEFGYCVDCGEEIASARLEHDPAAALCITCARG